MTANGLGRFLAPGVTVLVVALVMTVRCGAPPACPTSPAGYDPWEALDRSNPFADPAPPPKSIDEMADRMSIVVRGTYAEVVETIAVDANDGSPEAQAELRRRGIPTVREPVVLMEFEVDEYIVGEGPSSFVVGQRGDFDSERYELVPPPTFGEQITLVAEPWNVHPEIMVATGGAFGRLIDRGERVCYAFANEETFGIFPYLDSPDVHYAKDMSLEELHEAFRQAARERGLVVPAASDAAP